MIGIVINEKYKVEKKIGKGGFGVVYRAFDQNLKRPVAIKLLNRIGVEEDFKKRFFREAESLAKMNHPNIVTVYDCGELNQQPYLVMELVNGPALSDLIAKTSLTLAQLYSLSTQVCKAMAYAHDQGIIHRDLTLKNIMVIEDESDNAQVKILDFGLVKLLHDEIQSTGQSMMGTPSYMSPEQILGGNIDGRADIFSYGIGLFRIVNGRFPFEAEHPAALMYSIVNEDHIDFNDDVPQDLRTVIQQCLAKDPRERYRDFTELSKEFKDLYRSLSADVTESSIIIAGVSELADRSSKRNPYLNRVMINNPRDFFGRNKEIRKIYSRLDAPHPQSISVVGDRRIGKSSLMNYIYNRRNRKRNMQNYENAIFVYLDFQKSVNFDVPKFIDFLFSVFSYDSEEGKKYAEGEKTLDQLKEVVQEINDKGKRIIILMDEFEVITKNEKFEEDFFSFLRSLANSYKVAYVTSSCDELQLMCHNQDISDSPFFNIFSNLPLRTFSREEAAELITVPSKTEGIPLESYTDKIIKLSGYFPMYLQIACSNVFEHLLDNPKAEPDWNQITKSYKDEVFPHYSFIWDRMEETEQDNLSRIAFDKPISKQYKFINENLLRRGYLLESVEEPALFSDTFKDFVLAQMESSGLQKRSIFTKLFKRKG